MDPGTSHQYPKQQPAEDTATTAPTIANTAKTTCALFDSRTKKNCQKKINVSRVFRKSMFPIVPLNFNTKSNPSDRVQLSDLTGSSKLLVPGRVISSTYISHGALSMPIEARNLRGDPPVVQVFTCVKQKRSDINKTIRRLFSAIGAVQQFRNNRARKRIERCLGRRRALGESDPALGRLSQLQYTVEDAAASTAQLLQSGRRL